MLIIKMKIFVLSIIFLPLIWNTPVENRRKPFSFQDHGHDTRIINGDFALAGQFPFAAALNITTSDSVHFCGGTLLSNTWILTAAQCIENAAEIKIQLGSNSLTEDDSNRIVVAATGFESFPHPEFNMSSLDNDIGLIQLRLPIEFSDYIGQSYLPVTPYEADVNVTAIGWGQINDSEPGPVEHLIYVKLITISNEECKLTYRPWITDNMICVVGRYNEGMCSGDSGGPLIYLLNNQHPIIIGVASFHAANGCEGPEPSGYTRVFRYRDWILNKTGSLTY